MTTCPELLFGDIADYIDRAMAHLAAEDMGALAAMNAAVDHLGAQVAALPANIAADYAPEVDYLIEKMHALQEAMRQKQVALVETLDVSEKRLRAVRAYHGE